MFGLRGALTPGSAGPLPTRQLGVLLHVAVDDTSNRKASWVKVGVVELASSPVCRGVRNSAHGLGEYGKLVRPLDHAVADFSLVLAVKELRHSVDSPAPRSLLTPILLNKIFERR